MRKKPLLAINALPEIWAQCSIYEYHRKRIVACCIKRHKQNTLIPISRFSIYVPKRVIFIVCKCKTEKVNVNMNFPKKSILFTCRNNDLSSADSKIRTHLVYPPELIHALHRMLELGENEPPFFV